MYSYKPNG